MPQEPFTMPRGDVIELGDKVWVLGEYIGTVDGDLVIVPDCALPTPAIRCSSDAVKPTVSKEGEQS